MTTDTETETADYAGLDRIHQYWDGDWEGLSQWAWIYLNAGTIVAAVTAGYSFTLGHYFIGLVFLSLPLVFFTVRYQQVRRAATGAE